MICKECATEMFAQRNGEELIFKCPNPKCKDYGYKDRKEEK